MGRARRKQHLQTTTETQPQRRRMGPAGRVTVLSFVLLAVGGSALLADWLICLPEDTRADYVGRSQCIDCHRTQATQWEGSDHDLAMDLATEQSVLADFNDATLTHYGITSRMYREDGKFMVHTEGPDGEMADFQVKYVFGVEPLQQYMVETQRPANAADGEIGRVQVLRLSWDTQRRRWFYLSPPDVKEKLSPDDPLHWTKAAQNWNHMCAECHSTNVHKNFDVASRTFHTTFSEIDVSCEACHGPGSVHVQLAKSRSPFWDRRLGYGLTHLKDPNPDVEIHACAPCHSRRHGISEHYRPGENYYDHYVNGLLQPETYYADGQVLDEVYVFGSFIQSKMYQQKIRCTDCHDPHSTKVKFEGNQLCTSCHQHNPAKYDTPAHHRHPAGSSGAACVECHMPATPFMDVDPRRDHSLRVPRPDLSVKIGTPNACTGCHLDPQRIDADKREKLVHYSQWLAAARDGDEQVRAELDRLNQWALETVEQWYGKKERDPRLEYAETLSRAWQRDPTALTELVELTQNRRVPGIVRASALSSLSQYALPESVAAAQKSLHDPDPQVRVVAAANLEGLPRLALRQHVAPLLHDPIRAVRQQAARTLAGLPEIALNRDEVEARRVALDEYRRALLVNGDQSSAYLSLGILAEREGQPQRAIAAYETAIRVQPTVTGPRSNLAALLERMGQNERAEQLRLEELPLLERDAKLAPHSAAVQYRYGLALYLHGRYDEAESALKTACRIEPREPQFWLTLTLFYQKLQRWQAALAAARRLIELRPTDPTYLQLQREILQQAGDGAMP